MTANNDNKPSKPALSQIFNAFAAKAIEDYPVLKDKLFLYHAPTERVYGPYARAKNTNMQTWRDYFKKLSKTLNDAKAGAERRGGFLTICYNYAGDESKTELLRTLYHELGHIIAPAAYLLGERTDHVRRLEECVADAFSFIHLSQHDDVEISMALDLTLWLRARRVILGLTTHPSMPVLTEMKRLMQETDLSKVTPVEVANIAYRLALKHSYTEEQIKALKKAFEPIKKLEQEKQSIYQKLSEIMLADHGKHSDIIFMVALQAIKPQLFAEMDVLSSAQLGEGVDINALLMKGKFWDDIREKVTQRLNEIKASPQRELDDMEVLGQFDATPGEMIDPVQYTSAANQEAIRKKRDAYAQQDAPKKQASPRR